MRVVFWQDMLCLHTSDVIRGLAENPDNEVFWVVEDEISAHRRELGWDRPETGRAKVLFARDPHGALRQMGRTTQETVHIFTCLRGIPFVRRAFRELIPGGDMLGYYQEIRPRGGVKGRLRWCVAKADLVRYGPRISFALGVGYLQRLGMERWLRSVGYPPSKVFPFAYFLPRPAPPARTCDCPDGEFRMICVGQLIRRKGLDVLIRALGSLPPMKWSLSLVGPGPELENLRGLALREGVGDKVRFLGAMQHTQAVEQIAGSDLLLLPSRLDGWGATVAEALMRGVPAVCTDHCGTADLLLNAPDFGSVVPMGSSPELARAIAHWMFSAPEPAEQRLARAASARCVDGESGGRYLEAVLEHVAGRGPRPQAPWLAMGL